MEADRKAFLEERQSGIGASDAAAVLGLSPWGTPLSVYQSKVDPIDEQAQPTLPMWLGLRLEDVVAELFTARTGLKTRSDNQLHRHPDRPWLIAHLDFRVLGRPYELVECKTQFNRAGWGEPGTDEVPVYYWVQAQHEMLVTGAVRVHIPVLFGTYDFAVYVVERDTDFLTRWAQAADDFWHDHVEPRIPPPLEGDEFSRKVVRARWPHEEDGDLKVLPPERELLVLRLRDEEAKLKAQEEVTAALRNRVLDLIGDASGIEGSWGKITWKTTKPRTHVGWEQVADAYGKALDDLLEMANPSDDDETRRWAAAAGVRETAQGLFTDIEPGYRRIDIRWRKE